MCTYTPTPITPQNWGFVCEYKVQTKIGVGNLPKTPHLHLSNSVRPQSKCKKRSPTFNWFNLNSSFKDLGILSPKPGQIVS